MQARQKWHITADKGFASSSNARNELMLRDAGEFAGHIKRCEKDIRILKNATEGQIAIHPCFMLVARCLPVLKSERVTVRRSDQYN